MWIALAVVAVVFVYVKLTDHFGDQGYYGD